MLHLNDVVDGDLVTLRSGDQVVADGDVARSVGLMLDESPLTGESLPVARAEGERVLSGSFCVEGSGGYVVTGTGPDSYAWQLLGDGPGGHGAALPARAADEPAAAAAGCGDGAAGRRPGVDAGGARHPLPRGRGDRHRRHRHA